jgi:hypothetical protein
MINMNHWAAGYAYFEHPIYGTIEFNLNLPLEWQTTFLEAEEACACCGIENNCRECAYFEYSLLYQIIGDDEEIVQ